MKDVINSFIEQNSAVLEFLDRVGQRHENVNTIIQSFADFATQTKFNPVLISDFITILLLANDENIYEKYELLDLRNLFLSSIKLQEFNLDTYVEAAHFEWAVMDSRNTAKTIIAEGIEKATQKIVELNNLLTSIEAD